jgi:aerobic-type carbon monoxide dehydrogenase small subunit (CoxS/CutS family)
VEGRQVLTVEGLGAEETLAPLQKAFIEAGGLQCGFCTPGMLMSATALLRKNPHPTEAEIRAALSGNLCRCTGYDKIIRAVQMAAEETSNA